MCGRLVLVDLSKDCRPVVDRLRLPPEQASRQARLRGDSPSALTTRYDELGEPSPFSPRLERSPLSL